MNLIKILPEVVYPYSIAEMRRDYANTAFPATITSAELPDEVKEVLPGVYPIFDKDTHYIVETYAEDGGVYSQVYSIEEYSQEVLDSRLNDAKVEVVENINKHRDTLEQTIFVWNNKPFDSDPISTARILVSVKAAELDPSGFSTTWVLADNTTTPLTGEEMIEVLQAFYAFGKQLHEHAGLLKYQVYTAQDFATLRSIDIYNGWPDPWNLNT